MKDISISVVKNRPQWRHVIRILSSVYNRPIKFRRPQTTGIFSFGIWSQIFGVRDAKTPANGSPRVQQGADSLLLTFFCRLQETKSTAFWYIITRNKMVMFTFMASVKMNKPSIYAWESGGQTSLLDRHSAKWGSLIPVLAWCMIAAGSSKSSGSKWNISQCDQVTYTNRSSRWHCWTQ